MKLFSISILVLLLSSSCGSTNKSENKPESIGNSIAAKNTPEIDIKQLFVKPVYELHDPIPNIEEEEQIFGDDIEKLGFNEIISKIPVTPLPFGVKNLDEIDLSFPSRSLLEAPIDYDEENIYGLNDYFEENGELDPFVEHDGRCMPYNESGSKTYFSRRFPDLVTGEKVLLYYYTKPETTRIGTEDGRYYDKKWTSVKWLILVCEPTGKAVYVDTSILSADEYMRLSYIDENYNIRTKHYQKPQTRSSKSDRTPNGEIDEVSEEIINAKFTTLFHENFYKLKRPKSRDYYSETGRWHGTEDSASYHVMYRWIDNIPVVVERR